MVLSGTPKSIPTSAISQQFILLFSLETISRQLDVPQSQRRAVPSFETERILRPRSIKAMSVTAITEVEKNYR